MQMSSPSPATGSRPVRDTSIGRIVSVTGSKAIVLLDGQMGRPRSLNDRPEMGTLLAIVLLGEPASPRLLIAGLLMAIGVWLHLTEKHHHAHTHDALEHSHEHEHDEHHQHMHADGSTPVGRHTHWHRHAPITHAHEHYPDIHHQHKH